MSVARHDHVGLALCRRLEDAVDQMLDRFRNVLIAMTGEAVTNLVAAIPRDRLLDRLCLRQQQFKELLAQTLGAVWLSAR